MEEAWLLAPFPLMASILLCACAQSNPCRELNVVTGEVLNGAWLGKGLLQEQPNWCGCGWAGLYKSASHLCYHFVCLYRLIEAKREKSKDLFQTSMKRYGKLKNLLFLQLPKYSLMICGIYLLINMLNSKDTP